MSFSSPPLPPPTLPLLVPFPLSFAPPLSLSFCICSSLSLPLSVFYSLSSMLPLLSFIVAPRFISYFVCTTFLPLVFHPIHYHFPHHGVVQYQSSSLQTFPSPSITNTSSSPQVRDGACARARNLNLYKSV